MHQDPEVPLAGFLVLGTTRHIQSLVDLTAEEYQDVMELLYVNGNNSLSHIRPIMAVLKQRPPLPEELQKILKWVERLRTEISLKDYGLSTFKVRRMAELPER